MSGSTTQNIYQSTIPPFMEDDYKQLMADMNTEFDPSGYERYVVPAGEPGAGTPISRLEDFNDQQRGAFSDVDNLASGYQPAFDAAATGADQISGIGQSVAAGDMYDATDYENKGFTSEQYGQWMNPYLDNVLDRAQDRATTRFGEQQVQRDQQAAMTGGFGGSRRFVTNGLAQRDLNEQLSDLEASQYSNAFNQAQGALVGQRQLGEASKQFDTNTRLKGADIIGTGANLNLNLGTNQQKADLNTLNAKLMTGGMQQQMGQAQKDLDYQDFLNQRDWGRQMTAQHSNLLRGVPTANTGSTQTTTPGNPTLANQALGLATATAPWWARQTSTNSTT